MTAHVGGRGPGHTALTRWMLLAGACLWLFGGCFRLGYPAADDIAIDRFDAASVDLTTDVDGGPPPSVRATTAQLTASESAGSVEVTLLVAPPPAVLLKIPYRVGGDAGYNTDHLLDDGHVVVPAGASQATIAVPLVDDTVAEADEEIVIEIDPVASAVLGDPHRVSITVVDDDSAYCSGQRLTAAPYAEGQGTAADPYTICTPQQLAAIAGSGDLDRNFRLMTDLDLGAMGSFPPLGDASTPFSGNFDGDDHTLASLTIVADGDDHVGLFGRLTGRVWGLHLNSAQVTGRAYVGALAGSSTGTITRCSVAGAVSGARVIGGLAGSNYGTVARSHGAVQVEASEETVGGLIGDNLGALSGCFAVGPVTATRDVGCVYAGGLAGRNSGVITACYATGSVTAAAAVGGGLVGWNTGTVSDTYATGDVSVHRANNTSSCTTLAAGAYGGGLVGVIVAGGLVQRGYATGSVTSTGVENGGLIGLIFGNTSLNRQGFSVGTVSGVDPVGGLIGKIHLGREEGSYWDTALSEHAEMCGSGGAASGCDDARGIDTSQPQQGGYFFDRHNPPLASWPFGSVWIERQGHYPALW